MTHLSRRQIKAFADRSNEQLMTEFNAIEHDPKNRTTRGHVRLSAAKHGDRILDEIRRRRAELRTQENIWAAEQDES
jgi:hypothetical protein